MKKDKKEPKEPREEIVKLKYKDVGTCLRYKGKERISRSKFKKAGDAQEYLDMLIRLRVVDPIQEVYKCPECRLWHFGLKDWANK